MSWKLDQSIMMTRALGNNLMTDKRKNQILMLKTRLSLELSHWVIVKSNHLIRERASLLVSQDYNGLIILVIKTHQDSSRMILVLLMIIILL
jgi:hypothetical protein